MLLHSNEYTETVDENEKNEIIKGLNDHLDKIIIMKVIWRSNRFIRKSRKSKRVLFYQRFWW